MAVIQKMARIVNTALEGEQQYTAIQIIETGKIFEFSEVKFIMENNLTSILKERLNDNDLEQPIIRRILNQGHNIMISYYEPNKDVTLLF
jgi:hypothetical protein